MDAAICICPIPQPMDGCRCRFCGGRLRGVTQEPADHVLLARMRFCEHDDLSEQQAELIRQQTHRHDQ
jgi:hypothetical protein